MGSSEDKLKNQLGDSASQSGQEVEEKQGAAKDEAKEHRAGKEGSGLTRQELEMALKAAQEMVAKAAQELETIASERDTWRSKAETIYEQYTKARSDMEGYRRRTERDFEDKLTRAKAEFIKSLLDVMDNFDRFLRAAERSGTGNDKNFESFLKGVLMIERQLTDTLAREGVEAIPSPVGKEMNPELHEAVAAQEGGGEHGLVVEELQKGYTYKGLVLRPTKVKVVR